MPEKDKESDILKKNNSNSNYNNTNVNTDSNKIKRWYFN